MVGEYEVLELLVLILTLQDHMPSYNWMLKLYAMKSMLEGIFYHCSSSSSSSYNNYYYWSCALSSYGTEFIP